VKNILLKSLYPIETFSQDAAEQVFVDCFDHYQEMQDLSVESFQRNLQGDWDLVQLSEPQPTLQKGFQNTLKQAHDLWHTHWPCNILYTDPDTLCVVPFMPWDQFSEFTMFPNAGLSYYNGGVKYFPSTLGPEFWALLLTLMQTWDETVYDQEQEICKRLMLSQATQPKPATWAVAQGPINRENLQEYFRLNRCIWHFHSSRDPQTTTDLMQEVWQHYQHS